MTLTMTHRKTRPPRVSSRQSVSSSDLLVECRVFSFYLEQQHLGPWCHYLFGGIKHFLVDFPFGYVSSIAVVKAC